MVSLVSGRYVDSLAGSGNSNWASVSADGRLVAFESSAPDLVEGDVNGRGDIFVRDMENARTEKITAGSGSSSSPAISPDGRFVAFVSVASDLVQGDTNGVADVFLYDAQLDFVHRVSVASSGAQANGPSHKPSVASDGTVAFASSASNLVASDGNAVDDVFVHRLDDASTTRISTSTVGGAPNNYSGEPVISASGGHVAYYSTATNLVPGDTNARSDIFVWDATAGTTELVSPSASGGTAYDDSYTPAITADGRYVAFTSRASNLVGGDANANFDIFVRDRATATTQLMSVGPGGVAANAGASGRTSISHDGRFVAFSSSSSNLVSGDTNGRSDVFVRDRNGGVTIRVSTSSDGTQATAPSMSPMVSGDGLYVGFTSGAALSPSDQNGSQADVYLAGTLSPDLFQ